MSQDGPGTSGRQGSPNLANTPAETSSGDIDFEITREDASVEARRAGFVHLAQLASQPASSDRRQIFFETITVPVDNSAADLQIHALDILTKEGQDLSPFGSELIYYLNNVLRQLFVATENAREIGRDTKVQRTLWTTEDNADEAASSTNAQRESKSPVKEASGPKKALMNTFYLISHVLIYHPHDFQQNQLETLLTITTDITKRTTMRQALRGSLKIFSAIAGRIRIPNPSFKPTVLALCAIFGNSSLGLHEEAWICLRSLLQSEDCESVGDVVLNLLAAAPGNIESRKLARFRGALSTIEHIAQTNNVIASITPNLQHLMTGLKNAYYINTQLSLETLQTISTVMGNNSIVQLLTNEKWSTLRNEVDEMDRSIQFDFGEFSPARPIVPEVSSESPFYLFVQGNFAAYINTTSEYKTMLQKVAEQLLFVMEDPWQGFSHEDSSLFVRLLLHICQRVPALYAQTFDRMWDLNLLVPQNPEWKAHSKMIAEIVRLSPKALDTTRCGMLRILRLQSSLLRPQTEDARDYDELVELFCASMDTKNGLGSAVLSAMSEFCVELGLHVKLETLKLALQILETAAFTTGTSIATVDSLEIVSSNLVRLFMRCYQQSYSKTKLLYQLLLKFAQHPGPTISRLQVSKLLTRLRCTSNYAICIATLPSPEDVAVNLGNPQFLSGTFNPISSTSNRPSLHAQSETLRTGRSSAVDVASLPRSRSATRSMNTRERRQIVTLPSWVYNESLQDFPDMVPEGPSLVVYARKSEESNGDTIDLSAWLDIVIDVLQMNDDWELYSYVLAHLPLQLSNFTLFSNHVKSLHVLHNTVIVQLRKQDFHEPPSESGIRKGDVALCLYQILVALLPYHEFFSRPMTDEVIYVFRYGIDKWDRTGKCCIHALALCCYEFPFNVEKQIVAITESMQKRITQADLAMDILEFLGALCRVRQAFGTRDTGFYRTIFGICIRYLQYTWEQRQRPVDPLRYRASAQLNRQSGSSSELVLAAGTNQPFNVHGISQYIFTIAYQTIIFWFLSIDVRERAQHVGWLTQELTWKDELGKEHIQEQSLVILDMMHRTAFSDFGETQPGLEFLDPQAEINARSWLDGMSIITIEIATYKETGLARWSQITKRQASGTTYATYHHNTAGLPSHHVPVDSSAQQPLDVYLNHMFLQLTSTIAPTPLPLQPISLPDDDSTERAFRVFDKNDTVDGHKAGVIFIGYGQKVEEDILANSSGSDAYEAFISGLGTKVPLKGARFNAQDLNRECDEDGTHTIAWRDRVTEIVFHVATMMPTDLDMDPRGYKKKRHLGNDHVKIIFNASGEPVEFDTIRSEYNMINIVITPEAQIRGVHMETDRTLATTQMGANGHQFTDTDRFGHYMVRTLSSPDCPEVTFASEPKMVSAEVISAFVRQLAINASVFCRVWQNKEGEYISSWRARLQQIIKLREKYANTNTSANVHYPMSGSENTAIYNEGDTWTGTVAIGGLADAAKLQNSVDFTRWT